MTNQEFLDLLVKLADELPIEVHEQVNMVDDKGKPALDEDGIQVVNDVVIIGDGRIYIERDDNEPYAVQMLIDFLSALDEHLPDLIAAWQEWINAK